MCLMMIIDEIEDEEIEDYAERRGFQLVNKRRKNMANGGPTKQDLLDQIDDLQQENQDLQDQLDAIADIVLPPDDGDDDDDDGGDNDDN